MASGPPVPQAAAVCGMARLLAVMPWNRVRP
jgi:hypothetical protein